MEGYETQAGFWDKTAPRVMGDLIGRPSAVELMGKGRVRREKILEAGCGTGYTARMLVGEEAIVSGCDSSREMLEKAIKEEKDAPGIEYKLANIISTGYEGDRFYGVMSIGVLIHNNPSFVNLAYREAFRVLKPQGTMVVSVTHPYLFTSGSPSMKKGKNWVKHRFLGKENAGSRVFEEEYYDLNGNKFVSEVWDHSIGFYLNGAVQAGFKLEEIREPKVEEKHLLHPSWGKEYGYPAFLQFRMVKK
ncbi:MAG: class I SAM-dependent methyltransferase [Nanoarchaeota archaeon]|nr:class I SAM-dependent methyltransferase [Nanoarchaeota archaeon]